MIFYCSLFGEPLGHGAVPCYSLPLWWGFSVLLTTWQWKPTLSLSTFFSALLNSRHAAKIKLIFDLFSFYIFICPFFCRFLHLPLWGMFCAFSTFNVYHGWGFGIMRVGGSLELFGKRVHQFRGFDQFPGRSWLAGDGCPCCCLCC